MIQSRRKREAEKIIEVGKYKIEKVQKFKYLGTILTENNEEIEEIRSRIHAANKAYYAILTVFKNRDINCKYKTILYKTLIRPILTYGCENWAFTGMAIKQIDIFERKVLRRIYGPTKEGDQWRKRYNAEIYEDIAISNYVRIKRLQWAGHVVIMKDQRIPNKMISARFEGRRRKGRPRTRWEDQVQKDAKGLLGVRGWRRIAQEREEWKARIEEAKDRLRSKEPDKRSSSPQ